VSAHQGFTAQSVFLTQAPSTPLGAAVVVVDVEAVVLGAVVLEPTTAAVDVVEDGDGEDSPSPTSWTSAQFVNTSLQHNLSPMVASQLSAALLLASQKLPQYQLSHQSFCGPTTSW